MNKIIRKLGELRNRLPLPSFYKPKENEFSKYLYKNRNSFKESLNDQGFNVEPFISEKKLPGIFYYKDFKDHREQHKLSVNDSDGLAYLVSKFIFTEHPFLKELTYAYNSSTPHASDLEIIFKEKIILNNAKLKENIGKFNHAFNTTYGLRQVGPGLALTIKDEKAEKAVVLIRQDEKRRLNLDFDRKNLREDPKAIPHVNRVIELVLKSLHQPNERA
ncbi:MAG: hypothetical protein ABH803_00180 [Candidatus Micrarchaeota archaeon]